MCILCKLAVIVYFETQKQFKRIMIETKINNKNT